ncbi:hypothetical protein V8C34DRAFT_88620 [Trichoderma compactum]
MSCNGDCQPPLACPPCCLYPLLPITASSVVHMNKAGLPLSDQITNLHRERGDCGFPSSTRAVTRFVFILSWMIRFDHSPKETQEDGNRTVPGPARRLVHTWPASISTHHAYNEIHTYTRVYLIHNGSQTNGHVHSTTPLASFIREPTAASSQHSRFRFRSPPGRGQRQPLLFSRFSAPLPPCLASNDLAHLFG